MNDIFVTMKCNAFGTGVGSFDLLVEESGTVRVYEPGEGIYTVCHSLSSADESAAREKAALPRARVSGRLCNGHGTNEYR
jgi:hypothetical protein